MSVRIRHLIEFFALGAGACISGRRNERKTYTLYTNHDYSYLYRICERRFAMGYINTNTNFGICHPYCNFKEKTMTVVQLQKERILIEVTQSIPYVFDMGMAAYFAWCVSVRN